jgi:FkbM family methyltransferase
MISYAQNYEDVVLMRALSGVNKGFYVDCGAAHPVTDNVTMAFYAQGWSGINIEPDPEHAELLKKARPRDINLHAGAGAESGSLDYYRFKGTGYSTFSQEQARQWIDQGLDCTRLKLPVLPLNEIIARAKPRHIHFIKIDVEGFEKEVLKGIDLTTLRPWIFVIEATRPGTNVLADHAWRHLLESRGYERCLFDGINVYYCASERPDIAQKLAYPANRLDDFTEQRHAVTKKQHAQLTVATEVFRRAIQYTQFCASAAGKTRKMARTFPQPVYEACNNLPFAGKIFFDITKLRGETTVTGIERAVLNLATGLRRIARSSGLQVEFVGLGPNSQLIACRLPDATADFTLQGSQFVSLNLASDVSHGDLWISAELNSLMATHQPFYRALKSKGVRICSFAYDLFPLTNPEWSPTEEIAWFNDWWRTVVSVADMIITDSRKVAHQVADYAQLFHDEAEVETKLRWIHLGADSLSNAVADTARHQKKSVSEFRPPDNGHPTFLTVSTLHPRKALSYLIAEFSALWNAGIKINLILTGSSPYKNKSIESLIRRSPYADQFLIYAGYLSDNILIDLYRTVDCVIYPSYDEGFGLPVMEALYEGGAVMLRDTEVMREIVAAEDPVFWFSEVEGVPLRTTVLSFLETRRHARAARLRRRRFITWDDSAQAMLNHLLGVTPPV